MIDERIDKTTFEVRTFQQAEADDIDYWMSKTPQERIECVEYLRRWVYGDDQIDARLQRFFEVVQRGED